LWLLFMLMLVIAKPLFLDRGFEARTRRAPGKDLRAAPKISLVLLARRGSALCGRLLFSFSRPGGAKFRAPAHSQYSSEKLFSLSAGCSLLVPSN
jgi:hypothetical protein